MKQQAASLVLQAEGVLYGWSTLRTIYLQVYTCIQL